MISKKDIVNEILRKVRHLTQLKYDEADDILLKKLLAEDLALLSEIENKRLAKLEQKQAEKERAKLAQCVGGQYGTFIKNTM